MSKKNKRNANNMTEETRMAPEAEPETEVKEEALPNDEEQAASPEAEPEYHEMTLSADEVKALKEKLDKLQEDRDDAVKQAQRLQAEFENYRKRNAQISSDSRDDGVREAVKNMLPVLDNFERALDNAPADDPFVEGVRGIRKQFADALAKCGAEEIDATGKFDPNLHDAVMKDSVEGAESGDITAVFQKGWRVKGKIVRYAMVKVNE